MCGRYVIRSLFEIIESMSPTIAEQGLREFTPRYNVAPTQAVPILRLDDRNQLMLELVRWGLIPSWATDASIGNRMINARAETIHEKPAFRTAFRRRRCLVPADGFYEWKATPGGKQPYLIHMKDDRAFCFAGLWDRWTQPDQTIDSCTILTTSPNELTRQVHDRMPVILDAPSARRWLSTDTPVAELQSLLKPFDPAAMDAHPVSKVVNSPRNETPECIAPAM